ncbi:MAG: shikimate kinase [Deltaproteobacteria bacterium]|nr:MAG: shikimate kinase [Deltaproteobacteria bacterium]
MHRGVALGGFMATGKSTVGRALASRLGLPFVDLDEVLVERFGPIPEQFAEYGEAAFRERESAALAELCGGEPVVLATGGGTWVDPANRERLEQAFFTVVLDAPLAALAERVQGSGRPLWDESVAARYESRREAYAHAGLRLDARRPVAELVEEIAAWVS